MLYLVSCLNPRKTRCRKQRIPSLALRVAWHPSVVGTAPFRRPRDIAGVLLAATIPARPAFSPLRFSYRLQKLKQAFWKGILKREIPDDSLSNQCLATIAKNWVAQAPQQRMEHSLTLGR
jgi:hypothetical protein